MAAIKALFRAEHVHRAALALGIAVSAPRQLGHHALRIHAAGKHVPVIAIGGYDLVLRPDIRLHADDDGFLADIEVTETTDQSHAVELSRLLFEAADQQHVRIEFLEALWIERSAGRLYRACVGRSHVEPLRPAAKGEESSPVVARAHTNGKKSRASSSSSAPAAQRAPRGTVTLPGAASTSWPLASSSTRSGSTLPGSRSEIRCCSRCRVSVA